MRIRFWKSNDDLVISLLRLGKKHFNEGLGFREVKDHLKLQGFKFTDKRLESLFFTDNMFDAVDRTHKGFDYAIKENKKWTLNAQGYFYLLEHDELASARSASRNATVFAGIAILISAAAFVWSILDTQTVKLDPSQVTDFIERINRQK